MTVHQRDELAKCESPIETMLFTELVSRPIRDFNEQLVECDFQCQTQLGPYRADGTLIVAGEDYTIALMLECDGHDFHEKTPEQAARDKRRDRVFASKGWIVLRFTGREIVRDTAGCVDEIHEAIGLALERLTQ